MWSFPNKLLLWNQQKLAFFAALDIATKITKGCVEILNDQKLCEKGKKVGSSEAALLQMLDIKPFTYGLKLVNCWEGSLFIPAFLDYTVDHLMGSISVGITAVASLSLAISYPTLPAFKHVVVNGFRNLAAVALGTSYTFKEMEELKHRVDNPDAYAAATPTATPTVAATTAATSSAPPPTDIGKSQEVEKEQSDEEMEGLMDFF